MLTIVNQMNDDYFTAFSNVSRDVVISDVNYLVELSSGGPEIFLKKVIVNGNVDLEQSVAQSFFYWHIIVGYLRRIETLPGFIQLKQQLPTHVGYFPQLYATIYLIDSGIKVLAIENGGYRDADITAQVGDMVVDFHVKTVGQFDKINAQWEVSAQISRELWKRVIINKLGQRLRLDDTRGICMRLLTQVELNHILDQASRCAEVIVKSEQQLANGSTTIHEMKLTFGWHDNGSVHSGTLGGIDLFRNLNDALLHVESKIGSDEVKHVFLGVCLDAKGVNLNESMLEAKKISAMFFIDMSGIPMEGMHFERTKIFGKTSERILISSLEDTLPKVKDIFG